MSRRTIELRSGTWEWAVVDPDDPRPDRGRPRAAPARASARAGGERAGAVSVQGSEPSEAPPLPRRRIELRSTSDERRKMCVRVPPHLGNAGDEAAIKMLALNPDRRIVVDADGTVWSLWPDHREPAAAAPASMSVSRSVRAARDGDRPRRLSLPEGLALGQMTDRELLDLLA